MSYTNLETCFQEAVAGRRTQDANRSLQDEVARGTTPPHATLRLGSAFE